MQATEVVEAVELVNALWSEKLNPALTDTQIRELHESAKHVSLEEWNLTLRRLASSGDYPKFRPGCAVIWEALKATMRSRKPAGGSPVVGGKGATKDQARSAIAEARAALGRSA